MDPSLESLFNLYVYTPGRRLFALQQVRKIAQDMNKTELVTLIDKAIEANVKHIELMAAYQQEQPHKKGSSAAQGIDWQIDRTLGGLQDMAYALIKGIGPEDPLVPSIEALLKALFPAGLTAITLLPYVEELAQVDRIVKVARSDYGQLIAAIKLDRFVDRLSNLAKQFRAELESSKPSGIPYDTVRASAAQCQNLMLQVVAYIIGRYHGNSPEHADTRTSLLNPILDQNEAIGHYLRNRRSVPDVNPTTGENLTSTDNPVPAAGT